MKAKPITAAKTLAGKIRALQRHDLYQICFRRAGVGCMFHEEERALSALHEGRRLGISGLMRQDHRSRFKLGLVVYRYYPTIESAVDAEVERLSGSSR